MALADAVGGTQKNFIDLARKEAKKMGLKDVELYTANGLANGEVKDGKYPGLLMMRKINSPLKIWRS